MGGGGSSRRVLRSGRNPDAAVHPQGFHIKRPKPGSYSKFLSIDLSSPLGKYILKNKKQSKDAIDVANLCESARREARSSLRVNDFAVTCPKRHRRQNRHFHTYTFTPYQRWKRKIALETGKKIFFSF